MALYSDNSHLIEDAVPMYLSEVDPDFVPCPSGTILVNGYVKRPVMSDPRHIERRIVTSPDGEYIPDDVRENAKQRFLAERQRENNIFYYSRRDHSIPLRFEENIPPLHKVLLKNPGLELQIVSMFEDHLPRAYRTPMYEKTVITAGPLLQNSFGVGDRFSLLQ